MPKNPWFRYLLVLAASAVTCCAAFAGLNYFADPYGIYHYGQPGDWVKSRPRLRTVERLHKAHAVRAAAPDALLLGNSRVVVALNPNHPALPPNTYNLGLSACDIYECLRYLQHAAHLHPPKLLVFAIGKGMFDAGSKTEIDFSETRLSVTADGQPQPHWERADFADTLLSLTAVGDSLLTLAARAQPRVAYADGLRDKVLMEPYLQTANLLVENERWKHSARTFALVDAQGGNRQFEAFRTLLRLCAAQNIRVILFTNPVHAELLDIEYGDGAGFSTWLKTVVAIIAEESAASGQEIPFWNFYGWNATTTEPFPDRSQPRNTMQNYWEISHYRQAVGDRVLSRILGVAAPDDPTLAEFGRPVTAENVDGELRRLAAERARWQDGRPSAQKP